MNKFDEPNVTSIEIFLTSCNPAFLPQGQVCASPEETAAKLINTELLLVDMKNFIEYDNIDGELVK